MLHVSVYLSITSPHSPIGCSDQRSRKGCLLLQHGLYLPVTIPPQPPPPILCACAVGCVSTCACPHVYASQGMYSACLHVRVGAYSFCVSPLTPDGLTRFIEKTKYEIRFCFKVARLNNVTEHIFEFSVFS